MTDVEARPYFSAILGTVLTLVGTALISGAHSVAGCGVLALAAVALIAAGIALGIRISPEK
jgi:hypothetical protein